MAFQFGHTVTHMGSAARKERAAKHKSKIERMAQFDRYSRAQKQRFLHKWALGVLNAGLPDYETMPLNGK